jgi:hypothetical protein
LDSKSYLEFLKNIFFSLFFCLISCQEITAQDSSFVKIVYSGSKIKIPDHCTWKINRAFISSGDGRNIQISNTNFQSEYRAGKELVLPYYTAEMELLDRNQQIQYILYIHQTIDP